MRFKYLVICFIFPLILLFGCPAESQSVPSSKNSFEADCAKLHPTAKDFFDSLRILPVTVTSIDGSTLFYNYSEKLLIEPASAVLTEKSELPENFLKNSKGKRFFLIFCSKHFTIQIIEPIGKTGK